MCSCVHHLSLYSRCCCLRHCCPSSLLFTPLAARWSKTKQAGPKAAVEEEGGNRPRDRDSDARLTSSLPLRRHQSVTTCTASSSSSSSIVTMYTIPSSSSSAPRRTRRSRTMLALAAAAATAASLLTATPAVAQDLTGNLTSLTGTWSSGTGAVLTGPVSLLLPCVLPSRPIPVPSKRRRAHRAMASPPLPARPRVSVASHGAPFSAGQRQHSRTTQSEGRGKEL